MARGVNGGRTLHKSWGCPLLNATMPRWRYWEIIKYFTFDLKTERRRILETDKFCLASLLRNPFIEKAYNSNVNITIDEQLLPRRARCKFIQHMANKLDKFDTKFWMAVDVESKYNEFSYLDTMNFLILKRTRRKAEMPAGQRLWR